MTAGRLMTYGVLALLGVLVGLAGALVQADWFPVGLLLALLAIGGLCYGGVKGTGHRAAGSAAAVGWLLAVLFATVSRPEGDFLFGAGLGSYIFLLGGMLVAVICTTLPHAPASSPPSAAQKTRLGK